MTTTTAPRHGLVARRCEVLATRYLTAQALATVAWWVGLAWSGTFRSVFDPVSRDRPVLDAYLVGDLVVIAAGSALSAWAVRARRRGAALVVAGVAGGLAYATLTLLGWVARGDGRLVGPGLMLAAAVVTAAIAARVDREGAR